MPGTVRVRLTKLRPLSGRDLICSSTTVVPRSEEAVWSSGVSAWISTTSVICAELQHHVHADALVDAQPARSSATTFLKPVSSALTV